MRKFMPYIAWVIITTLVVPIAKFIFQVPLKLAEDAFFDWLNSTFKAEWEQPVGAVSWPLAIISVAVILWITFKVAQWSLSLNSAKRNAEEPIELKIDLLENKYIQTFDGESKQPKTALYFEVLTTLSSNGTMQIGDLELVLSNGMRVKAQEKPVNTLERTESHWLQFVLPNKARGRFYGHISILANGRKWETDDFVINTPRLAPKP